MNRQDLFVAGLAMIVGILCLIAAFGNSDLFYRLHKIQWIESRWGRGTARFFYMVLGGCMFVLAVYIGAGR